MTGYIITGFAVGFVIGLTGVGGGSLMTPSLILFFGIQPAVAVGTDLLYAALTKACGALVHRKHGTIEWRVVKHMAYGSVPAALLTIYLLDYLQSRGADYQRMMSAILAAAMMLTALFLLFQKQLRQFSEAEHLAWIRALHRRSRIPPTCVAGVALGFLVTLSSVGAGVIGAAFLIMLYPEWRPVRIVGTDLAHAVLLTAVAGLGHVHLGTVDWGLLFSLLVGSLPGVYLGSQLGVRLPDEIMRWVLGTLLFLLGGGLLLSL